MINDLNSLSNTMSEFYQTEERKGEQEYEPLKIKQPSPLWEGPNISIFPNWQQLFHAKVITVPQKVPVNSEHMKQWGTILESESILEWFHFCLECEPVGGGGGIFPQFCTGVCSTENDNRVPTDMLWTLI